MLKLNLVCYSNLFLTNHRFLSNSTWKYFFIFFFFFFSGFVYSQGLSEDVIGGLRGAAAFVGIIGTFLYPIIRRKVGLQRTGLYALAAQITSLTLCVISVFAPGSPFDPLYFTRSKEQHLVVRENTTSAVLMTSSNNDNYPQVSDSTRSQSVVNSTWSDLNILEPMVESGPSSYVSIALLLTGIIGSRAGKLLDIVRSPVGW